MTQEEKLLLLQDLSGRLPYGVLCRINGDDTNTPRKLSRIEVDELDGILLDFWTDRKDYLSIQVYLSEVKPYLRPMSSMTEDELNECVQQSGIRDVECPDWHSLPKEKHFDARLKYSMNMFLVDSRTIQ